MSAITQGPRRDAPRRPLSLRGSLAAVVAFLAMLANAVPLVYALTAYRDQPGVTLLVLGWLVVVVVVSAVVGYYLSGALLSSLTRLRSEVTALSETGVQHGRGSLPDAGPLPEEVESLRASFAGLLEHLEREQDRRSAFMATLVHDLKTPIIAANHVLSAIRDQGDLTRERRIGLINSLLEENQRTLALVQKMVDAHRFERGEVTLELEPTDLGELARGVAERFKATAAARGIRLGCEGAGRALASRAELERALANLVDNAQRYAATRVTVTVHGATLTVADDGPGLPSSLEDLAQPFNTHQVELAGKRYTAGTGGLGLFIASQIVAAHGGTLEAIPAGEGTAIRANLRGEA